MVLITRLVTHCVGVITVGGREEGERLEGGGGGVLGVVRRGWRPGGGGGTSLGTHCEPDPKSGGGDDQ